MFWDNGKLGLRQKSRMTYEESNGKAYVVGQREAGTQVYRSRKEARSGMTQESNGKAYIVEQWKLGLGVQIWDGWCCEKTLDELPTDGLRNVNVDVMCVNIYSTEPVLSTELSQAVTKELVTNGLTFNL